MNAKLKSFALKPISNLLFSTAGKSEKKVEDKQVESITSAKEELSVDKVSAAASTAVDGQPK